MELPAAFLLVSLIGASLATLPNSEVKSHVLFQPRHVHISYADSPTSMYVTWSTVDNPFNQSVVEYGLHTGRGVPKLAKLNSARSLFTHSTNGSVSQFTETGPRKLTQFIHRVRLDNLAQGQYYIYHVGSEYGWSNVFWLRAMPPGEDWSPRLAVYGDLGNENAQSLARLQREVQDGLYDAVIHAGDFAYDMETDDGLTGDSFMEQIESIAAYVPYMTCPGNHEQRDNFLHYKSRFTMPGWPQQADNMFYSFNIGPIHFVSFSSEYYYFLQYGIRPLVEQYEWLERDLEEAASPSNRSIHPWIITYAHRPMYCSNNNSDDCTRHDTLVRKGVPFLHWFGLEDLFNKHGVDLSIWAHEHSYERMWPVYDHKVFNGSVDEPYNEPRALVHVTSGSAGCRERHDLYPPEGHPLPSWSAFRSVDYGYSRIRPLNSSHLYFEQVSDDQGGVVIDSFVLVRGEHGPYRVGERSEVAGN